MLARITTPAQTRGFALMGSTVEPLVQGEDTAGAWEAVRTTVGPGGRSPLHTMATDKVFCVLAGELALVVGDEERTAGAGTVALVPAGTPHRYRNDGGEAAQLLVLTTGDGHVGFLRGMSALTAGGPPAPEALAAHARAHGVRILAPASA